LNKQRCLYCPRTEPPFCIWSIRQGVYVLQEDGMPERRTRRFHGEFKAHVVKRMLEGSKPLAEVATELDVSTQRTE
jgi:hypothetical protein